ncbi:MAG: type II-A CRISPR-associated protein Csn2 [Spirochaetia bacterium]|nr:type II-A CRISPR-associated protein Csn2 [Spirochaetia bacterium]
MMLVHNHLEYKILFDQNRLNTIIIESPLFMTTYITQLNNQINGQEGGFILSKSPLEELDISKNMELIINPIIDSTYNKKFATKLINSIKKLSTSEELYKQTVEIQSILLKYASLLTHESNETLLFTDQIDLSSLLKLFNFSLDFEDPSMLENIISYMKALNTYTEVKIFAFANIKSYLTHEELLYLYETATGMKSHLFLIENHQQKPFINKEKCCIIDIDLCEIFREGKYEKDP